MRPMRSNRNLIPLFLAFLMFSSLSPLLGSTVMNDVSKPSFVDQDSLVDYDLYVAAENQTAGGDGFITTERPDSGGQEDASALDGIEFRSAEMISDLNISGTGNSGNDIRMYYYMQFTGQEGSTADVTISLEAGGFQIADKTISIDDPCNS